MSSDINTQKDILKQAKIDMEVAENMFNNVNQKDLTDIAILRMNSAQKQLAYAIKSCKG